MFKKIENLPDGILGFETHGKITANDYETVLIPAFEEALKAGPVKLLFVMPDGFEGYEVGAAWDDAVFGIKHFFDFRKFALVTDSKAMATLVNAFSIMIPAEVKVFEMKDRSSAELWLAG